MQALRYSSYRRILFCGNWLVYMPCLGRVCGSKSWECKAAGESDGRERLLPEGRLWLQKRQESMNDGDGGSGD